MRIAWPTIVFCVICIVIQQSSCEGNPLRPPQEVSLNEKVANPVAHFRSLLEKHKKLRKFLCASCLEMIKFIEKSIEKEDLKKDAIKICDMVTKNNELSQYCRTIAEKALRAVYEQLKNFEPRPEVCVHIRLCDSCDVSLSSRPGDTVINGNANANPALLFVQAAELQTLLTKFVTEGVTPNDNE